MDEQTFTIPGVTGEFDFINDDQSLAFRSENGQITFWVGHEYGAERWIELGKAESYEMVAILIHSGLYRKESKAEQRAALKEIARIAEEGGHYHDK